MPITVILFHNKDLKRGNGNRKGQPRNQGKKRPRQGNDWGFNGLRPGRKGVQMAA